MWLNLFAGREPFSKAVSRISPVYRTFSGRSGNPTLVISGEKRPYRANMGLSAGGRSGPPSVPCRRASVLSTSPVPGSPFRCPPDIMHPALSSFATLGTTGSEVGHGVNDAAWGRGSLGETRNTLHPKTRDRLGNLTLGDLGGETAHRANTTSQPEEGQGLHRHNAVTRRSIPRRRSPVRRSTVLPILCTRRSRPVRRWGPRGVRLVMG